MLAKSQARMFARWDSGQHAERGFPVSEICFVRVSKRRFASLTMVALAAATVGVSVPMSVGAANSPVSVRVTAAPNPVNSGSELTYTIVVTNTGGASLKDIVLVDQVNAMTGIDNTNNLLLSTTSGSCTQSQNAGGQRVTCNIGTLPGFGNATATIRGKVTAAGGTVLNNNATVTGTKSAQTFTASGNVAVQVQGTSGGGGGAIADLTVSVSAPSTVYDDPLPAQYWTTITVNNLGTMNASDVRLTASVTGGATVVAIDETSLFDCSGIGASAVSCTGGAVNAGANATVRLQLDSAAAGAVAHVLTVSVDPTPGTVPESNELNNAAQATTRTTTTAPTGTLVIEKLDLQDPIGQYQQLTYVLDVTNTSAFRADYVSVVDGTTGLDAVSITAEVAMTAGSTGTGPTCTVNGPTVTCETTRFQPGASMQIRITGTVIVPAGSTIINTATVTGNIKNKGVTSSASEITTVRPSVDLTVTQYRTLPLHPADVRGADRFDYTITVGNSGIAAANNVVVRETLPPGVVFDDTTNPNLLCESLGGTPEVVQCVFPLVAAADTEQTVLELIAPHAIGSIQSTVVVDPDNNHGESDETNNTFNTVVDVKTGIDLTITKDEDLDPVARNGTLRYAIVVTNLGTQNASDILVRDELPAGTVFRSVEAIGDDHGFTCGLVGGYVECTGGSLLGTYSGKLVLPEDSVTIHINVFAPDVANATIRNEVRVDPNGTIPEKDEANNIAEEFTKVENGHANGVYRELHISLITANFDPVATSGTLEYTLTVNNSGSAAADNVVVRAELPAGAVFRYANDAAVTVGSFTCAESGGFVTCSGGTLLPSGQRQLKIGVFAPAVPRQALLEAIVDPDNSVLEADEFNNQLNLAVQVISSVGALANGAYNELHFGTLTFTPDPVSTDGVLVYTIPVVNSGSHDAFGVSFRATLPPGARFISADDQGDPAGSFSCTESGGVVSCTGGLVKNYLSPPHVVKISVFAPSAPGNYRLDLLLDPGNAIPEGHEGNNAGEIFTNVTIGGGGSYIDLRVTKTGPDEVAPGANITYEVKVFNTGTNVALNVLVRDVLPAGTTFVSATANDIDSNFLCQFIGGAVECSGGYILTGGVGNARTITIVVKAPLADNLTITNQVLVDPLNAIPEASEVNNTATKQTLVESNVDLTVTAPQGSVAQGSSGDITATVTATGSAGANGVVVVFNLPVGIIVQNTQAHAGWSCQTFENPVNQVVCTGDLDASEVATFTFNVYKAADGGTDSSAIVDPDNAIVEDEEGNNTDLGTV